MIVAFLGGLGKAPTFLVPIINPPFADNSPHSNPGGVASHTKYHAGRRPERRASGKGHSA